MRLAWAIVLAVFLGAALGVGTAMWRMHEASWNRDPIEPEHATQTSESESRRAQVPKVAVDREEYDFGVMDMGGQLSHDFKFTNVGRLPLTLSKGPTSCKCTVSEIEKAELQPGESTAVTLRWNARGAISDYHQTATINTSDPSWKEVTLTVSGRVAVAAWTDPTELVFSQLSSDESDSREVRIFGGQTKSLKVSEPKFSDAKTAQFFQVTMQPITDATLLAENHANSGVLAKVVVKAGLPMGAFQQVLTLNTNLEAAPSLSVSVKGKVESDLAVAGHGWDSDMSVLMIGIINSQEGAKRQLMLVAHGPKCNEVKFTPVSIEPDLLKVEIGKTTSINGGKATETPLTIEIPKASRPANHLGSEQGKLGKIVLATNHPHVPQLRIYVSFLIEGE
jgi:hypothetical protein